MGVKGLWTLLEPCGRRIDVHALRGKKLAVDASVWIFRFLKAMRDDRGDPLPNAHLIGFLRRICKLLYLNVWPVFVFDGSTPALKRKTVHERRKRREQQQARVKRTAEKLLLNRLKQYAVSQVKEKGLLGEDGGGRNREGEADGTQGLPRRPQPDDVDVLNDGDDVDDVDDVDDNDNNEDDDDDDLLGFEVNVENGVDPEVLSTLPPSMQLEIMLQVREKNMNAARGGFEVRNGKPEEFSQYQMQQYLNSTGLRRQLDAIRGVSRQDTDVARRVAGEEGTHYVLYRDEEPVEVPVAGGAGGAGGGGRLQAGPVVVPAVAAAAPAVPAGPAACRPLKISFDVKPEATGLEDDSDWEEVDEGDEGDGVGAADAGRHQRSKYWSLSHGFQKGRSLGSWGGDVGNVGNAENAENVTKPEAAGSAKNTEDARAAVPAAFTADADDARRVSEAVGKSLDDLIDDEQGMIDEAIRRSLQDVPESGRRLSVPIDLTAPAAAPEAVKTDAAEEEVVAIDPEPVSVVHRSTDQVADSRFGRPAGPEPAALAPAPTATGEKEQLVDVRSSGDVGPPAEPEDTAVRNQDVPNTGPTSFAGVGELQEEGILGEAARVRAPPSASPARPTRPPAREEPSQQNPPQGSVEGFLDQQMQPQPPTHTQAPLPDMDELMKEEAVLRADRRKASGQGDSPTDQMFTECQELLQLFGIPYIIAPTEAEAQCAWLDANGLVDGVVTDDNDAFLFGSRRVYRHIFEESKYVEEYRTADIERELGLSREGLISLALLLGSDYTAGIAGVGVVNAVEIMSTFPGYEGLIEFEKWVNGIDDDIVALVSEGRSSRGTTTDKAEFKSKHKSARKSWVLPEDFPSKEVMDAYRTPGLDQSKDKFTFVSPDFRRLVEFAMHKFGWEESRIKELLDPVEKSLKERDRQQTLDGTSLNSTV